MTLERRAHNSYRNILLKSEISSSTVGRDIEGRSEDSIHTFEAATMRKPSSDCARTAGPIRMKFGGRVTDTYSECIFKAGRCTTTGSGDIHV